MLVRTDVESRLARFRADLLIMEHQRIVQKHITLGGSCVLDDEQHFNLISDVAAHFGLHPGDVVMVGSAKLGFSIARNKRYRPFGDTSDIDLALVSGTLFDALWQQVFEYWDEVGAGEFWSREDRFKEYLFRGWIRPDMLPPPPGFPERSMWFEYFRRLTNAGKYGPYKIGAGLYKSRYFLEKYQSICVRECQQESRE